MTINTECELIQPLRKYRHTSKKLKKSLAYDLDSPKRL